VSNIYRGTSEVSAVKVGSVDAESVYVGSELVWPTGDPYWSSVVTLIQGDDQATGSTKITDTGPLHLTWTAGSGCAVSQSVFKYGAGSIYFSGVSSSQVTAASAATNFQFGFNSFTVEFWLYCGALNFNPVDFRPASTNGNYPTIAVDANGALVYFVNNAARIQSANGAIATSTWYHIAWSREAGVGSRLFLNGVQVGSTYNDSGISYVAAGNRPIFGSNGFNTSLNKMSGCLDDIRITKAARYTSNFTPPSKAFPTS
jgi:hypothetical protein